MIMARSPSSDDDDRPDYGSGVNGGNGATAGRRRRRRRSTSSSSSCRSQDRPLWTHDDDDDDDDGDGDDVMGGGDDVRDGHGASSGHRRPRLSRTREGRRSRRRPGMPLLLVAVAAAMISISLAPDDCDAAAASASTEGGRRWSSSKKAGRRRRKRTTTMTTGEESTAGGREDEGGGLTLGDLDRMTTMRDSDDAIIGPEASIFGSDAASNRHMHNGPRIREGDGDEGQPDETGRLRGDHRAAGTTRINLDLSGRVMCHVLSPAEEEEEEGDAAGGISVVSGNGGGSGGEVGGAGSVPLFTKKKKKRQEERREKRLHRGGGGGIIPYIIPVVPVPHVFLGADYDLDEIWYGATRWIARCSWRLPSSFGGGIPSSIAARSEERAGAEEPSSTIARAASNGGWQIVNEIRGRIFPPSRRRSVLPSSSSSPPPWILDVEGERSVFDGHDSTARMRLTRRPPPSSSSGSSNGGNGGIGDIPRLVSIEYDSAKYFESSPPKGDGGAARRSMRYAPTVALELRSTLFHPRLEFRSKKTLVARDGGDRHGNYYGGNHFGDPSSPAERRLESIREGYRESVPRSSSRHGPSTRATLSGDGGGGGDSSRGLAGRISDWLEDDGWMPRRATADLMGNLRCASEVGLGNFAIDDGDNNGTGGKKPLSSSSSSRSLRGIIVPSAIVRDAGIRLRVSKRVDWTSLGIFPWSNNNGGNGAVGGDWRDALRSTRLRLELCGTTHGGVWGGKEDGRASAGVEFDPLDLDGTLRFVVERESVAVIGGDGGDGR